METVYSIGMCRGEETSKTILSILRSCSMSARKRMKKSSYEILVSCLRNEAYEFYIDQDKDISPNPIHKNRRIQKKTREPLTPIIRHQQTVQKPLDYNHELGLNITRRKMFTNQ